MCVCWVNCVFECFRSVVCSGVGLLGFVRGIILGDCYWWRYCFVCGVGSD